MFDASGHAPDADLLEELSRRAAAAYDTLPADGRDACETEWRVHAVGA
jgi:hypothetical protein